MMLESKAPVMSLFPRILKCGLSSEVSLALENAADGEYLLRIMPASYQHMEYSGAVPMTVQNGKAYIPLTPAAEQEYKLIVFRNGEWIAEGAVYALEEDLFELNPYKGDFHIHSSCSDGTEPPAEVAAQGRAIGLDIMALTDHGQYQPSLEAILAYEGLPIDLCLCPGEEVHPPDNPVHIIHFGGKSSINALFNDPAYRREVSEIQASLPILCNGCDPYEYASSLWVFRKIRELGGMSIFCHPYWRYPYRNAPQEFYISEGLTSQMFTDRPFDAYEVLGGYSFADQDSNTLQTARYHEERVKGPVPIVGVSDAHGCYQELFGWYFTIIFSKALTIQDIKEGITTLKSVAVEKLPGREHRVYGPMRLAAYALFLLREYFPVRDALCDEEGKRMMDWFKGDASAKDKLTKLVGQTASWREKCFGR